MRNFCNKEYCLLRLFLVSSIYEFTQNVLFSAMEGDCDMVKYLEDPSLMPVDVELRKQEGGITACQDGGYCVHL